MNSHTDGQITRQNKISALSYKEKDKKTDSEDGEDTIWPEESVVGEGPFQLHLEEGRNMELCVNENGGEKEGRAF